MNVKEDMLKKKKEINEKTEIFIFSITSESIYQTEFDDIEESLETFRTKIYWSSKKDKVDRHPVQSRLVKMNPTKS